MITQYRILGTGAAAMKVTNGQILKIRFISKIEIFGDRYNATQQRQVRN